MSEAHNTVSLNILGKLYKVKCPQDKIAELREAAQYVENKMRDVAHGGKTSSVDRLAVVTALNITHELLAQKTQARSCMDRMGQQIDKLQTKVEEAIALTTEKCVYTHST